jgi:hypothetical protein
MHQTSYTRAETRAKVGRRVCTHMALDGIPQGTVGTVKHVDCVIDGYDLEIAWAVPERRRPMVGWYTRTEDEGSVVELDEGPRGRGELIRWRAHQHKASTPSASA